MKNSIAERIADFLKNFPPFKSLPYPDLLDLSNQVQVVYLEKNAILFQVADTAHHNFYVVKDGAIGLSVISNAEEILIDQCDEGDIIGLRPFFAKNQYAMAAKAQEESILYGIPIEIFKPFVMRNQEVLNFLLESFASNTRNPYDKDNQGKLISENSFTAKQVREDPYFQPIVYTEKAITAQSTDLVEDIAKLMSSHKIGSVIIEENQLPVGIVTDKDLRFKIATGQFPITVAVSQVMSAPVITVSRDISIAEAQLLLLKDGIGHLCVTKDGTPGSKIIGILSEHDILVVQTNNPGVILKLVKRATQAKDLKEVREKLTSLIKNSIASNIPIQHISNLAGEINLAITRKAINLAIEKLGEKPPVKFAWMNVGSQGRREQLLLTDQDNALVFEDVEGEPYEKVKNYFLELAAEVNKTLNIVGYEYCPAEMMAGNPLWCKSLSEWKKQFSTWIIKPGEKGIMMCTIFFDYDFVYGDERLTNAITEEIFKNIQNNQLFFAYMGTDALRNPPPIGFFRQFLVESDGEHKDTFDIKSRAMLPLIDAARLLVLSNHFTGANNTMERFKKLAELEPQNREFFEACAEAFANLMYFRTREGLSKNSSGRFLNLKELSKSDKVKLKNSFQPIHELQAILKQRFQLSYFT
jgi:CBS domain-containing protein